jgi:predicted nucleotidyltransferase
MRRLEKHTGANPVLQDTSGLPDVPNVSTIVLTMRTYQTRAKLTDVLFGQTRREVLGFLYSQPDKPFYLRELARHAGTGLGAVQREVVQLAEVGILRRSVRGNQVFYQANQNSPIFQELKSIISKTAGTHDILREALFPLRQRIRAAFVYGSVARHEERANSDVDLMVVGEVPFTEIAAVTTPMQERLGREINPTVYPLAEFQSKLKAKNHFLKSVLRQKKLFILGDENELAGLAS